jgi:PEP-CTERM motif
MIKSRAMLLAGVSALAVLACAGEADAETFIFTGGVQSFPVLVSGEYSLDVFGASGGNGSGSGGLGAEVSGDIALTAGETLTLFVGGQGQNSIIIDGAGGGGGGGFVFLGASVLAVAGGGGGGGALVVGGGPGQAGTAGGMGGGAYGGAGGASGSGGGGKTAGGGFNGGSGAGANPGAAGYGDDGFGGGSYLAPSLFINQALTAGVHSGDGSIDIELLKVVPEPSTWAMTLIGFAGLGWLTRMRKRKTSPA